MELWTFRRYRKPQLCVDAIELEAASRTVRLQQGSQSYQLAFDDAEAARNAARDIASLQSSASPFWNVLKRSKLGEGWGAIGEFLDQRALVRETADDAAALLAKKRQQVEVLVLEIADAALAGVSFDRTALIAGYARHLLGELREVGRGSDNTIVDTAFSADRQPNFYLGLLVLEFEYFARASPLTLLAVRRLLERFAGAESHDDNALDEGCMVGDLHDLESHLWLVAQFLLASAAPAARRMPLPALPQAALSTGIEFMRRVEVLTRETLALWGENPYVTALDRLGNTYAPLVAGPFIEQYHVTRRFVEIIAASLPKRLAAPLRQMMFRYYGEEYGHEALESTTCEALGVTQQALDRAIPLPLHFAFVDMLTLIATIDPVASFASIMVIEGVFGEPPKMSLRLAAVARANPAFSDLAGDHDELNEDLNHNSIARDALSEIGAVTAITEARVIQRILFLLELNHRAWGGIADFYGPQAELRLLGPLGVPFAPQDLEPREKTQRRG